MSSAEIEASLGERPRPTIAPVTTRVEESNTINWPAPNPGGSRRLPMLPPIALAQPPPLTEVVNHGSQALTATTAAKNATSQPGRRRRLMVATLTSGAAFIPWHTLQAARSVVIS